MKTIKKGDKIKRFNDLEAQSKVKSEGWSYCPKSEFKSKPVEVEEIIEKEQTEVVAPKQKKRK